MFTTIPKNEIAGIRYGIHFIKGLEFYIGREYQIFIKTSSVKELKICFKSLYRRKLNEKHKLFCTIVDEFWNYYLDDILDQYIQRFNSNEEFILGGIFFKNTCIQFDKKEILYSDLAIKKYHHYMVIYSKEDQYKNKMLYFLKDDNAILVSTLIGVITKNTKN